MLYLIGTNLGLTWDYRGLTMPLTDKEKEHCKTHYRKHREEKILKVRLRQIQLGKRGKINSSQSKVDGRFKNTIDDWDDSREYEIGVNPKDGKTNDPRLEVQPHFRTENMPNNAPISMFWDRFKPKNNVFYGEKVNARCGKLIDTVMFE